MSTESPVGVIGLGAMGGAIAARLALSVPLLVNDRSEAAVARLEGERPNVHGASLSEIGRDCRLIITSLPTSQDVLSVISGDGRLVDSLTEGAILIDMTTGDPSVDKEIHAQLTAAKVDFADSPVSGGPQAAEAGTLSMMVGASDDTFAAISQTLGQISPNFDHVGPVGAGHAMKLVNNMLSICNRFSAMEAVTLATRHGIDIKTCLAALNKSSGRSYSTESTYPKYLVEDEIIEQHFSLGLTLKDITLALSLAESSGIPLRIAPVARSYVVEGVELEGANSDVNAIMRWFDTQH